MESRYLHNLGVVSQVSSNQKGAAALYEIQPTLDFFHSTSPHQYVSTVWEQYKMLGQQDNGLNGTVFELVLACALLQWEINPFYMQAEVQFVPNAAFDFLIYDKEIGPVTLSAKTSLRERYKQSDLEAMALKQVHRKAQSHLVTLNAQEAIVQKRKLLSGEIAALDSIVVATDPEFDDLIDSMRKMTLTTPPTVPVLRSGKLVKK